MKLPHADRAVVEPRKVRDYLLSIHHPVGEIEARYFLSAGYSIGDRQRLRDDLLRLARTGEATFLGLGPHGREYEVRGTAGSGSSR